MIEITPFLLGVFISAVLSALVYSVLGTFRGKKDIVELNRGIEQLRMEILDNWEEMHARIDVDIKDIKDEMNLIYPQIDSRFDKLKNHTDMELEQIRNGLPKSLDKLNQVEDKLGNFVKNLSGLDNRVNEFIKSYQSQ